MPAFPMFLHTARLVLRVPGDEDARLEHEMILESLEHLWPWFAFRSEPPTVAARMEYAARRRRQAAEGAGATYVVFAGGRPVGDVFLEVDGHHKATMGWWLRAGATGHGYATEAVRAVLDLARNVGVERVEARTDPDNLRSRAVAERAGFVLEAIQNDVHDRADGVRRPDCVYTFLTRAVGGADKEGT